jgi:hypothetical protein
MHTTDLAIKHTTAMVVQGKNNVIVDSFPASKQLRKKVHILMSTVANKKAKQRFAQYNEMYKRVLSNAKCSYLSCLT